MKRADSRDMRFDLTQGTYQDYRKPNNGPLCANKNSKPSSITKQISTVIDKRISSISSNKEIFNKSIPYHEHVLKKVDTMPVWNNFKLMQKPIWVKHFLCY